MLKRLVGRQHPPPPSQTISSLKAQCMEQIETDVEDLKKKARQVNCQKMSETK